MVDFTISVTETEQRRLREFINALQTKCAVQINSASTLNNEGFESEFRSKLLTRHCFVGSPLFRESFDSAFIAACSYAGHDVEHAPTDQSLWDVKVNGKKISLRSSKSKFLRVRTLHISSLMEASSIFGCRTAAKRREETHRLIRAYCAEVDAIIQLRYFQANSLYELVEIPVDLFSQVLKIGKAHFASDGPTINIPIGKKPCDFTLKLDRSDAKITIGNINKDLCTVHGTWQLPV